MCPGLPECNTFLYSLPGRCPLLCPGLPARTLPKISAQILKRGLCETSTVLEENIKVTVGGGRIIQISGVEGSWAVLLVN